MISPNMNLNIPVVATTPGPQYAQEVNSSLNKIDIHNHTSGQGVQIPSSGLNINANISMNSNGLSNASIIGLVSSSLPATNGAIYRNNDDLYFRDGAGNNVRITQGGVVAVSGAVGFSGLPFGTASASYDNITQSFIFESATNTPANIDVGSITIREVTASPNGITLSSPAGLGSSYSMTLPSGNPVANSFLMVGPTGTITNNVTPDGTTIQIVGNQLTAVPQPNYVITAAPGVSATSNVVLVTLTVDNLTITTTGNPVVLGAVGGGASGSGSFFNNSTGSQTVGMRFLWYVGGVLVSMIPFGVSAALGAGGSFAQAPPSAANTFLVLPAGTHSIELRFTKLPIFGSVGDLTCQDIRIYAYELR